MAADHFCLRWNNYQSNMVSELDILRTEEHLVDVSLCCEGHKFTAHKVILSACSPYFRNVFKENPCEHPVVILKDVSSEDVEALLSFIYQGVVYISEKKLSSFLQTAELLQIKGLAGAASSLRDETAFPSSGKQSAPPNGGSSPVKRRKSAPVRLVKSGEEGDESNTMEAEPSPTTDDSQTATDSANPPSNDPQVIKAELMSYDHSQDTKQDEDCSGLEEEDESETGCSVDGLGGSGLEDKGPFYLGQVKTPQTQFSQPDSQSQLCSVPQQTTANSQGINSSSELNSSNQFPTTPPSQVVPENVSASGERNGRRPCPLCTKVISNKSNLLKHMRIRHSDAYNPACCVLCNKIFKNKYSLRAHLNIYHKEYINPGAGGGGQGNQQGGTGTPQQQVMTVTNGQQDTSQQVVAAQQSQVQVQVQNNQQVTGMTMQQQVTSQASLTPQIHLQAPPPYQTLIHTSQQANAYCIKTEQLDTHPTQFDLLSPYIK